jgi:hypothetical protein
LRQLSISSLLTSTVKTSTAYDLLQKQTLNSACFESTVALKSRSVRRPTATIGVGVHNSNWSRDSSMFCQRADCLFSQKVCLSVVPYLRHSRSPSKNKFRDGLPSKRSFYCKSILDFVERRVCSLVYNFAFR